MSYWYDPKLSLRQKLKIELGIADSETEELVPLAKYVNVQHFQEATGRCFYKELVILTVAGNGAY